MAVQELAAAAEEEQTKRSRGHLARAMARLMRKKIAVACIVVLSVIYSAGIFAAWVSPYDYTAQDYTVIRKAPSYVLDQGPVAFWKESHFAGTDRAGRDLFTRVLWGIQNTVILTLVAMLTGGLLIGVSLGLIAGYYGRGVDSLIMRTGEVFASFPDIFLVIIIAATLRPRILDWMRALEDRFDFLDGIVQIGVVDYFVVSIALVGFGWIGMARLVRGQILFLKETQYIEAAKGERRFDGQGPVQAPAAQRHRAHSGHREHGHGGLRRHRDHPELAWPGHTAAPTQPRHDAAAGRPHQRHPRGALDAARARHRRVAPHPVLEPPRGRPQ